MKSEIMNEIIGVIAENKYILFKCILYTASHFKKLQESLDKITGNRH